MDITEDTKLKERRDTSNETWNAELSTGHFSEEDMFYLQEVQGFQ